MARISPNITLEHFQAELDEMFAGTGLTLSYNKIEEDLLRVGFRQGKGEELHVDLRAGPKTKFGRMVLEAVTSGKETQWYAYRAEGVGVGEAQRLYGTSQAFVNYITSTFKPLPIFRQNMTMRQRLSTLRAAGYISPEEGVMVAGGVLNINPENYYDETFTGVLEGVTVAAREKWQAHQAWGQLKERGIHARQLMAQGKKLEGEQVLAKYMPEYMVSPTGGARVQLVPIPGIHKYNEQGQLIIEGIGAPEAAGPRKGAEIVAKRQKLWVRQSNVDFLALTPEGRVKIAEPGIITKREQGGYRLANLSQGGELAPMYFQPRTLQLPGGVPSGSLMLRREAWETYQEQEADLAERDALGVLRRNKVIGGGYKTGIPIEFPDINPAKLSEIEISPGIFMPVKGGGYRKIADYEGYTIPGGESAIVGLLKYRQGEETVVHPLRAEGGALGFTMPAGGGFGLNLQMPKWYSTVTGEAVTEPPGTQWRIPSTGKLAYRTEGRGVRPTDDLRDMLLSKAQGSGLSVGQRSQGGFFLTLTGYDIGGMSIKSGTHGGPKVVVAPQAAVPGMPTYAAQVPGLQAPEQYWAITADVKLATQWFQWMVFGGLPNPQQEQMLRELEYADPSKRGVVNKMIQYMREAPVITKGGKSTRIPDINVLGEIYAEGTGTAKTMGGFNLMEDLRQRVLEMDPALSMKRYQVALLPEAWYGVREVHKTEVPFLVERYKSTYGTGGAEATRSEWEKYVKLRAVPGRPDYFTESVFGQAILGPTGGGLTMEWMTRDPRINLAGQLSTPQDVAEEFGYAPGMSLDESGMITPAGRAWRGIQDIIGWSRSEMTRLPSYRSVNEGYARQFKIATLEQVRATGVREFITPTTTPREISQFLTEKLKFSPEIIELENREIFAGPALVDPLATYRYGLESGVEEAVSKMGRTYSRALVDVLTLKTTRPTPVRNWANQWLEDLAPIAAGKEIHKLTTSVSTETMVGGRYIMSSGPPLNVGVIPTQNLYRALRRSRKLAEVAPTRSEQRALSRKIMGQIQEMGGIPSLNIREPNVWEQHGAVPAMLVTPEILKQRYGLDYPEGTIIGGPGGPVEPGTPWFTGVLGALGIMTIGQQGDWDMDQMTTIMGLEITKDGIVPNRALLAASKQDPGGFARWLQEGIEQGFGKKAGSAADIVMKQLEDIRGGLLPGMDWERDPTTGAVVEPRRQVYARPAPVPGAEVQHIAEMREIAKQGMGVAHRMRSWIRAAGTAIYMTDPEVRGAVSGMAGQYQRYLDYTVSMIEAQGEGFSPIEMLWRTSTISYNQDTNELQIWGKTSAAQEGFSRIASSYAVTDPRGKPGAYGLNMQATESLVWALAKSNYTSKSIGYLLGQNEAMRQEITEKLDRGMSLSDIMLPGTGGNIWQRGYDVSKTPLGLSYFTMVMRRAMRPGREKTATVWNTAGEEIEIPVTQMAGHFPMPWFGAGEEIGAVGAVAHDPLYMATKALFEFETGEGIITPEAAAAVAMRVSEMERMGIEPSGTMKQFVARHPVGKAAADLTKEKWMSGEDLASQVGRMSQAMKSKGRFLRASATPFYATESYEEFGRVWGDTGAGEAAFQRVRHETRLEMFMERVLGFTSDEARRIASEQLEGAAAAESKMRMTAGEEFEEKYTKRRKAAWTRGGRVALTGIRGGEGGYGTVTVRQLAEYEPTAEVFGKLIEKYPEIETWGIRGTPDIIRISPEGMLVIGEVKQIDFFGRDKIRPEDPRALKRWEKRRAPQEEMQKALKARSMQVRLQLSTYLLGAVVTSGNRDAFHEWAKDLISQSREYREMESASRPAFLVEAEEQLWQAAQKGVVGEEIVNIREGITKPKVFQELADAAFYARHAAAALGEAYEEWTRPDAMVEMLTEIKARMVEKGIPIPSSLHDLFSEIKIEPKVPDPQRKVKIRLKRQEAKAGETEPVVAQLVFPQLAKSTEAILAEVERARTEVGALKQLGALEAPMRMINTWRAAMGQEPIQSLEGINIQEALERARVQAPFAVAATVQAEKALWSAASKTGGLIERTVKSAGRMGEMPGVAELRAVQEHTGVPLSPTQANMGDAITFLKTLGGMAPVAAALTKNFAALTEQTGKYAQEFKKYTDQAAEYAVAQAKYEEGEAGHVYYGRQREVAQLQAGLASIRAKRSMYAASIAAIKEQGLPTAEAAPYMVEDERERRAEETTVNKLERLQGGGTAKGMSKMMRSLIGGWGIFYMQTLLGWPAKAMSYGLQEQQAYQQQMTSYAAGQLGTDVVEPFEAVGYDVMRSKLVSGTGAAAGAQLLSAGTAPIVRELGGVAMGGVAGLAMSSFLKQAFAAGFPKAALATSSGWGPVGIAAGLALTAGLSMYGNIKKPEQAAIATAEDFRAGKVSGWLGSAWRYGIPNYWEGITHPWAYSEAILRGKQQGDWSALAEITGTTYGFTKQASGEALLAAARWTRGDEEQLLRMRATDPGVVQARQMVERAGDVWTTPLTTERTTTPVIPLTPVNEYRDLRDTLAVARAVTAAPPTNAAALLGKYPNLAEGTLPSKGAPVGGTTAGGATEYPFMQAIMGVMAVISQEPRFAGYSPEILGRAGIRLIAQGKYHTPEFDDLLEQYASAETAGIPYQEIGAQLTAAMKQPYTASTAGMYERWITSRSALNMYSSQAFSTAARVMEQMPLSYIERTTGITPALFETRPIEAEQRMLELNRLLVSPSRQTWLAGGQAAARAEQWGFRFQVSGGVTADSTESERYAYQQAIAQSSAGQDAKEQLATLGFDKTFSDLVGSWAGRGVEGRAQLNRFMNAINTMASANLDVSNMSVVDAYSISTIQGSTIQNLRSSLAAGLQTTLGVQGLRVYEEAFAPGAPLGMQDDLMRWTQAIQGDPIAATQLVSSMAPGPGATEFAMTFAAGDVSAAGVPTGLPWGTTSYQRGAGIPGVGGAISSADMAKRIWGPDWRQSKTITAAVEGYQTPYGKVFGQRAYAWQQIDAAYNYQKTMAGIQAAGIALQREYMPQFFALQTQMAELGYEQQMSNFAYQTAQFGIQKQQFTLQGQQFYEQMGLQQRQVQMQRGWTQQDWTYQQNVREMQWGWRVQDFQEQARFMSGRERRLAERQMARETTMYGMESEQIEKQKERQKELWAIEDQRFEMQKRQFEEGRALQKESMDLQENQMKLQKEFYEEGYRLQRRYAELQYEYQMKQLDLQAAAAGAAAKYAEDQHKVNVEQQRYKEVVEDIEGKRSIAQSDQITFWKIVSEAIGSAITGAKTLRTVIGNIDWDIGGGDEGDNQYGGVFRVSRPTRLLVGERGPETVAIIPEGGIQVHNPWLNVVGNQMFAGMRTSTVPSAGRGVINLTVKIGDKHLGSYVVGAVTNELEI